MRVISTFCLALLVLAGCHSASNQSKEGAPLNEGEEGPPTMDYRAATHTPLHLTPTEHDGLTKAVQNTPFKGTGGAHIHADVQNGNLVFIPEPAQDASHVAPDAPRITLGGRNPRTVAVVATPAAQQLLQQRASPSQ